MSDLEVLKEIPGYKAILKSVLKSQIQLLMEQLSEHTGEESIILTASVNDGSLSHLGSNTGKGFLEGRDEIKSQFLGYCLKTYHKKKTHEPQKPYQRTHPSPRSPAQLTSPPAKRSRAHPVSLSRASPAEPFPQANDFSSETNDSNIGFGNSGAENIIKTEQYDNQSSDITQYEQMGESNQSASKSIPGSVHLSHTQTSSGASEFAGDADDVQESIEAGRTDMSDLSSIKVEQVEDELEITGVEMAARNLDSWDQGQPGYDMESNSSFDQSAEQSRYKRRGFEERSDDKEIRISTLLSGKPSISSLGGLGMEKNMTGLLSLSSPQTGSGFRDWTGSSIPLFPGSKFENLQSTSLGHESSFFGDNSEANIKKRLSQEEYRCEFCGKVYQIRQHLSRHYSVHTGERMFLCSLCQKDFRLKHHLKEHLILVHKKLANNVEPFIHMKK